MIAALFRKYLKKKAAYQLGAIGAFITSLLTVLAEANGGFFGIKVAAFNFVKSLPLDSYGFNWVIPTIVLMIIGCLIPSKEIEQID